MAFTDVTLSVALQAPAADVERAQRLLETAKKYCIVSNSLKQPVNLRVAVAAR